MLLRGLLILPRARRWMRDTIVVHRARSRSIVELGFARLPRVFSHDLLEAIRAVEVPSVPQPPLQRWGIQSTGLLAGDAAGITLDDMIFVRQGLGNDESLLFHELVHAIQWRTLGVNRFLALYGVLLIEHGYREHPLETMAYDAQRRFDSGAVAGGIAAHIERRTGELFAQFRRRTLGHRLAFMLLQ